MGPQSQGASGADLLVAGFVEHVVGDHIDVGTEHCVRLTSGGWRLEMPSWRGASPRDELVEILSIFGRQDEGEEETT
jgi:hypothetical protein